MKDLINNHSIAIFGKAATGKTKLIKSCFDYIQTQAEFKTISINCHNCELVYKVNGVTKNKISASSISDKSGVDLKILDVDWQDLEFETSPGVLSLPLIKMLTEKISEFVENSDIPCIILIEELGLFTEEGAKQLIKIREVVVQNNGYFLITRFSSNSESSNLVRDQFDTFTNLTRSSFKSVSQCAGMALVRKS